MTSYWIQCPHCGSYEITEKAAQPFLSPEMRKKIRVEVENGARAIILEFDRECPRCSSTGESTGRIRVLRPLQVQNP